MKYLRSWSFQNHILLSLLVVAFVPLLVCNTLIVNIFNTRLQNQMNGNAQNKVESIAQDLEDIFSTCDEALREITRNPVSSRALLDRSDTVQTDVNLALFKAGNRLRRGAVLSLYDAGGSLRFTSDSSSAYGSLPVGWGILRKARDENSVVFYNIQRFSGPASPYVMHTAEPLYAAEGVMVGYALISLPDEMFRSAFSGLYSEQDVVIVLDATGEVAYCSKPLDTGNEISFLRDRILTGSGAVFENENSRFYIRENTQSGFYMILVQPQPFTGDTIRIMRVVVFLTSIGSLFLCVVFSTFISRSLSRPVNRLSKAMEQLKQGMFTVRVETKHDDQLGRLLQNFNIMAEHLQLYIDKNLRQQREISCPHLLYVNEGVNPSH